jgi:hypothetical protein
MMHEHNEALSIMRESWMYRTRAEEELATLLITNEDVVVAKTR